MQQQYDVVVVGGGAAGLSGALALSRARRSALVIDSGSPRNASAGHVHNFLTRDGTSPADLLAAGRREVIGYGGEVESGEVVRAEIAAHAFVLELADGRSVQARRLLITTGLVDELPELPGLRELWGRDVLHCPYCHGWEVRNQPIGILATSAHGVMGALLWRQWSDDVVLFRHRGPELDHEQAEQLSARGIRVVDGDVVGLEITEGRLSGVRLAGGEVEPRAAVVVSPRFSAASALLSSLGLEPVEVEMNGVTLGQVIPVDQQGATSVPGVWAAGNVSDFRAQVITSAAAGLNAGAMINMDLVGEDTRQAVAASRTREGHRHQQPHESPGLDVASWEERYRTSAALWSGRPNAQLVAEVAGLAPGRALDVGCGEGGDAIWLAEQGWQTTGVDWSQTALDRAAEHADRAGVGDRLQWQAADVHEWTPPDAAFDLVSAQFLHPTEAERPGLLRRLAGAVAPGGTLLWVGHDVDERHVHWGADRFVSAETLVADLPDEGWQIEIAETRPRAVLDEGDPAHLADVVVRARRA